MSNYPPGVTTKMIDESQGAHIDPHIEINDDLAVEVYRTGVVLIPAEGDPIELSHTDARYMAHRILERL